MDRVSNILNEITLLTLEIKTNYPEIYNFLEEDTLTLPFREHQQITLEVLNEYLESLKQLLSHYQGTHTSN